MLLCISYDGGNRKMQDQLEVAFPRFGRRARRYFNNYTKIIRGMLN